MVRVDSGSVRHAVVSRELLRDIEASFSGEIAGALAIGDTLRACCIDNNFRHTDFSRLEELRPVGRFDRGFVLLVVGHSDVWGWRISVRAVS